MCDIKTFGDDIIVLKFFFNKFMCFIILFYFFGCIGSSLLHVCFSLVAASEGYSFFFFFNFFIYLVVLGLSCSRRVPQRGLLFVAVLRLLIVLASLVAEHGF